MTKYDVLHSLLFCKAVITIMDVLTNDKASQRLFFKSELEPSLKPYLCPSPSRA